METSGGRRSPVAKLVARVDVGDEAMRVVLHASALACRLGAALADTAQLHLVSPAVKLRQGKATKLVLADGSGTASGVDARLVQLLADARAAHRAMLAAPTASIKQVALAQRQCRQRFTRLLKLAWLAPSVVIDILEGRHPQRLTTKVLLETELPMDWTEQREVLGFV